MCFAQSAKNGTKEKGYGPAYGTDFGFKNTKIQHDRFRISYTSLDGYEARDFALLRAEQIAEIEGYSHFKIIDGQSYKKILAKDS